MGTQAVATFWRNCRKLRLLYMMRVRQLVRNELGQMVRDSARRANRGRRPTTPAKACLLPGPGQTQSNQIESICWNVGFRRRVRAPNQHAKEWNRLTGHELLWK